jgi:acetolactate synthase-1/2/3 large subunit
VTTIILNNSKYKILINEYKNVGADPGESAMNMLDLGHPGLDWVHLAEGLGVEAARATSMEQCADFMRSSFKQDAPFVIELII